VAYGSSTGCFEVVIFIWKLHTYFKGFENPDAPNETKIFEEICC
jgi:hypothetical protein